MSESRLRRFVADASHELRTPLTSIRGYAELLRKGAFNDEDARLRASERIEHEAARMSVLVDDLLLLARLDQGRPLERSAVDVAELVSDAVEAARAVDPGRPISLEGHDSILVEGDAVRLRQIVDNLLHNAEVHTQHGTPVHLRVTRVGESAVITVADEGLGLDAEEQARVFDRFYRGSEARTGGGTGLGLSIVAALAVAHGGQAHVASVPGQGTTFTVELPALGQSVEGGSSPEEEPSSSAGRMAGARVGERGVGPARR
jgi:two-component system OmpR family sensor kinase